MSILIKGMEMPQEKKITLTIFPDGRVYENHGERLWGYGEDCIPWKAVPVPPHGDLIDGDAVVSWLYDDEPSPWKAPFRLCTADRSDVKFLLKNAPTIIPPSGGKEDE